MTTQHIATARNPFKKQYSRILRYYPLFITPVLFGLILVLIRAFLEKHLNLSFPQFNDWGSNTIITGLGLLLYGGVVIEVLKKAWNKRQRLGQHLTYYHRFRETDEEKKKDAIGRFVTLACVKTDSIIHILLGTITFCVIGVVMLTESDSFLSTSVIIFTGGFFLSLIKEVVHHLDTVLNSLCYRRLPDEIYDELLRAQEFYIQEVSPL